MRQKVELDMKEEFWFTGLFGVSEERFLEITDEKFCGLPDGHSVAEHLTAMWNREDVTDGEMAVILYDKGVQVGFDKGEEHVLEKLKKLSGIFASPPVESTVH